MVAEVSASTDACHRSRWLSDKTSRLGDTSFCQYHSRSYRDSRIRQHDIYPRRDERSRRRSDVGALSDTRSVRRFLGTVGGLRAGLRLHTLVGDLFRNGGEGGTLTIYGHIEYVLKNKKL